MISNKHQYQSKPYVTQSLIQWSNKTSSTLNVDAQDQRHESLPTVGDSKKKNITAKNRRSINKISPLSSSETTGHKIVIALLFFRYFNNLTFCFVGSHSY